METLYDALNSIKLRESESVENLSVFPARTPFGDLVVVVGGLWKPTDKSTRNKAKSMIKALGKSVYNDVEDCDDYEGFMNQFWCYAISPTIGNFNAFIYGSKNGGIKFVEK